MLSSLKGKEKDVINCVRYSRVYRPTRHITGHFVADFMGQMTNSVTELKEDR